MQKKIGGLEIDNLDKRSKGWQRRDVTLKTICYVTDVTSKELKTGEKRTQEKSYDQRKMDKDRREKGESYITETTYDTLCPAIDGSDIRTLSGCPQSGGR